MAEKMDVAKKKCMTPEFRVSFPNVFEPKAFEDQAPKYSLVMLFPKSTDLSKPVSKSFASLKQAAFNAATEKWGPKEKWPKKMRLPFRDGDEKEDAGEEYKNTIFVSASSKQRPGVVDATLSPITADDNSFYAGCYARATLIAFAYDKAGNVGVSFSLQNVQKTRDGDPLGGRRRAEDEFEKIEDSSEDASNYEESDELGF